MNRVHYPDAIPSEEKRLLNLTERTGFNITVRKGQRIYGPPPYWIGDPPTAESEVFVSGLPKTLFEYELVPFIERAGRLYELRLMMNCYGRNRGYAFVKYTTPEEAMHAIRELNGKEIRQGCQVGVVKSNKGNRLYIGGVPQSKRREEIHEDISQVVEGVEKVIVPNSFSAQSENRGYVFVDFESHQAAASARRNFLNGVIKLWKKVAVDWAKPEIAVDEKAMSKVKVLFIRNLNVLTTGSRVQKVFEERTRVMIEKVKIIHNFGYIHFYSREDASRAIKLMNGFLLDGSILEVTWAKPFGKGVCTGRKLNRNGWRMGKGNHQVKFLPETPKGAPAMTNNNCIQGTACRRSGVVEAVNNCQCESLPIYRLGSMLANISVGVTHPTENKMTQGHSTVSPPNAYDFPSFAWRYTPHWPYIQRM